MAGSTISSTLTQGVTLGYGGYSSQLSITSQGEIRYPAGYGILISDVASGTVVNSGSVIGGGEGIYLGSSDATIINQGYIAGNAAGSAIDVVNFTAGEALVSNGGTLKGAFGIHGDEANVTNSGYIYGSNAGIRLQISTIANSGTIAGSEGVYAGDGVLTNHGSIRGKTVGITIAGGSALNFGSISGGLGTGARLVDEIGGGGATVAASLANYGGISGGNYGVYVGSGSFTNAGGGDLSGRIGLAVDIAGAANNKGAIYGGSYGAELKGEASMLGGASLSNSGSIGGAEIGVTLGNDGALVNSGDVYGRNYGAVVANGYLTNTGSIVNGNVGVLLAGGVLDNSGTISALTSGLTMSSGLATNYGTIYGAASGALVSGGSLANFRDISGQSYGVSNFGGSVSNYGLISSASYAVAMAHGMLTNAGTISGLLDAVEGQFITLAVEPGAVFIGQVVNSGGKSLLELAGAGFGTLGGIGSQITGFNEISFAAGPQWSIEGDAAGFGPGRTIVGFAQGNTIVLDGFSASSDIYVKNTGLELAGGTGSETLDITGNFTTGSFQVTESGGDTTIAVCFAEGTRIAVPGGEVAVEALGIGDPVCTLHGGVRKVKWIGRRCYDGRFIRGNKAVLPVCIKAGAIDDGVPSRDLLVSPGHAISIDDVLVHAIRLVNGVSITQAEAVERLAYYHVELETHEILLAENCPAESFMGEDFRRQFQNAEALGRLYPGEVAPELMCQPRLESGFQLQAILRRLRARAGVKEAPLLGALRGYVDRAGPGLCFGWAQDAAAPEVPVCLDILCDGRRVGRVLANLYRADVAGAGRGDGYQGFEFVLPAGVEGAIEVRRSADGEVLELAAGARLAA